MDKVELGLDPQQLKWLACAVENARKKIAEVALDPDTTDSFTRAMLSANWYWIDAQFSRFFLALPESVVPENPYRISCGSTEIRMRPAKGTELAGELESIRNAITNEVLDNRELPDAVVVRQFLVKFSEAMGIWDETFRRFPAEATPDGSETNKP